MFKGFVWNESLELGVRSFDDQHRHIFALAVTVDHLVRIGAACGDILSAFEPLYDAFIDHFSNEEAMMLDADLMLPPSMIEAHVTAHTLLLRQLESVNAAITEGGDVTAKWAEVDVAAMLIAEIARHDGELITALARSGHLRVTVPGQPEA